MRPQEAEAQELRGTFARGSRMTGHNMLASAVVTQGGDDRHSDPEVWGPHLERILDRQSSLYDQLDGLSRSQASVIESEQTEQLLGILGQRQLLIEQIQQLNKELTPFVERWDELAQTLAEARRERLRERFERVAKLVEMIERRDEIDRAALDKRRRAVGREMGSLTSARGAVAAYGRSGASPTPRYQDREG